MARDREQLRRDSVTGPTQRDEPRRATGAGSGADADKLDGQDGVYYLARGNHSGTQASSTISDLNTVIAAALATLVDSAPGTLDTLNELAAALGNDPNFATTVTTALAGKISRNACMAKRNSNATAQDYSAGATLFWANEEFDDSGWHSTSGSTEQLVVPTGVSRVRVGFALEFANVTVGATFFIVINKNGASFVGAPALVDTSAFANPRYAAASGPIAVVPTDIFTVVVICSDNNVDLIAASSGFWIEAV